MCYEYVVDLAWMHCWPSTVCTVASSACQIACSKLGRRSRAEAHASPVTRRLRWLCWVCLRWYGCGVWQSVAEARCMSLAAQLAQAV